MAHQFGNGSENLVSIGQVGTYGANNCAELFCGWFYPTTLTSGLYWWSNGGGAYLRTHSTTAELRFSFDTTSSGDPYFLSSTAVIVVNRWQFIAIAATLSSSSSRAAKGIVYDDVAGWRDMGFGTQQGTTGGNNNSATILNVASGSSTLPANSPFIGSIHSIFLLTQSTCTGQGSLPIASAGTIATAEWEQIRTGLIMPMAYGTMPPLTPPSPTAEFQATYIDLETGGGTMVYRRSQSTMLDSYRDDFYGSYPVPSNFEPFSPPFRSHSWKG